MQVNRVNNQQPTFGMKYVSPRKWNPEILKTLMDSNLVKEIDAKYPKAKAIYEKEFFGWRMSALNNVKLTIQLAKDKSVCLFNRYEKDEDYGSYQVDCNAKIRKTTLADLEKAFKRKQAELQLLKDIDDEREQVYARAKAENAKGRTPFQNFICKLFGID